MLESTPASASAKLKRLVLRAGLKEWWEENRQEQEQVQHAAGKGGNSRMVLSYSYGVEETDYAMLETQLAQLMQAVNAGNGGSRTQNDGKVAKKKKKKTKKKQSKRSRKDEL